MPAFSVFPAYAGMSPTEAPGHALRGRFPRLRGDEPRQMTGETTGHRFSPPTRG